MKKTKPPETSHLPRETSVDQQPLPTTPEPTELELDLKKASQRNRKRRLSGRW